MKLCVYAICKNEIKFLDRWMNSILNEADYIAVLDTGSTDGTYDDLCTYSDNSYFSDEWTYKAKVIVDQIDLEKELGMMRFDKARNKSLSLVPIDTDICVVLDLDQVPVKGWSEIIKQRFEEGYTEVHGDIVDHDENGNELNSWRSRNVHPNSPYWIWERVIHEGIQYYGNEENKIIYDKRFVINHYPDLHKDRSLYTKLLKYSCKEYPKDPYYGNYLGIELSRRGTREEACQAFKRCLKECDFQGDDVLESQVYMNLAICTDDPEEALKTLLEAKQKGLCKSRRFFKLLADYYEKLGYFDQAIYTLEEALTVKSYSSDWTDDLQYFNGYIEDRLSLFYYYKKQNYLKALEYCIKAIEQDPENARLKNNLDFYLKAFTESIRKRYLDGE